MTALGLLLPRLLLERHALVCTETQPPPPHSRRYTGLSIWPCSFKFLKAFETGPISAVWTREKNETPVSIAQLYPATDENHVEASMNFMSGECLVTAMLLSRLTSLSMMVQATPSHTWP